MKKEMLATAIESLIESSVSETIEKRLATMENRLEELTNLVRDLVNAVDRDQLLNKKEACKLLSTSYPTLRSLQSRGIIAPILSDKNTVRFSKRQLLEAKARMKVA